LRRPVFLHRKIPKFSPQSKYIPTIYLEYHSVCPLVGIGTPHPLSRKRVCFPPGTKGGGGVHTRLRVRGWGSPNPDDWRENLVLCLLCEVQYIHYPVSLPSLVPSSSGARGSTSGGGMNTGGGRWTNNY
jgi:hypothetical protein